MTRDPWPAETLARAEKAIADLEAFWDRFQNCTTDGRKLELPKLQQIRRELVSVTNADGYALEHLTRLDDVCRQLTRSRQPSNFDESRVVVHGLGDVSNMRGWMYELGLVKEAVQPYQPQ
jgi:predicted YcjX-like family ATPase